MTSTPDPFDYLPQLLEQFRIPGLDTGMLPEARRKDVEALVEANRMAVEGMRALAARQVEVFQQTMSELQAALASASGAGGSIDPARHAEIAQELWQKAVTDMRDLAELAHKSQIDAMATIGERMAQNLQEMRRLSRRR